MGTGLYNFGARYYEPSLGIFFGVDPLADLAPDKTPYHYTSNNPINRIDPDGRNDDWVGEDDGCGNITWKWDASITSLDQAKAAGYDAYQAPGSTLEGSRIGSGPVATLHFGGTQAEGIGYDESTFTNWNNINGSSYGNQLEAYRAWQSDPGYHRGEGFWDRTFRVMAYGSMEARRDFASGGMNMYGGYGRAAKAIQQLENIDDYVSVFHKGKLNGGVVSPYRSLSTGLDKASVSSLGRAGNIFEFKIPRQLLNNWLNSGSAQRLRDLDHATGVYNEEIRFSGKLADQLNKYLIK